MTTVDGTDFPIYEPKPFSTKWYSHKFKGPGLRYEVCLSIQGGNIVHTNGPFPCGSWPDITVFRDQLINKLSRNEMVEADRGYRGEPTKIRLPGDCWTERDKAMKQRARACQESVNRRLRQFKILGTKYRHSLKNHRSVFRAVAVITQVNINTGNGLFFVDYY